MTISSSTRKAGPFTGTGTATTFPFTFKVFQASDLLVVRLNTSTNVESALVLNTDYTVSLNQNQNTNPGGSIVLGSVLATGFTLTATSDIQNLQPTDLTNQGGFYPTVINDALDRATIQIQQLQEKSDRSLKLPVSSTASPQLPGATANNLVAWNSTGDGLTNIDPTSLATVVAYATAYADVFIGNGITTSWTLTRNPASLYNLDVSISGSSQEPGRDYTLSGTTFTMTTPPPIGARVLVKYKEGLPNATGDSQDIRYLPGLPNSVTRTVQSKLRESVSVLDFGAVGNGTTDDTTAIQTALNTNSGNVSVYFPKGVYKITSTILIPQNHATKMYGDGFNPQEVTNPVEGTIIKWAGAANGLMFSSNVSGGANTSGLTICDIRFDGDNIASRGMVIGADSAHPQHEYFENVQFRNFAFNGTDAALDLAGASYSKYGVADSNFVNVLIDGGARALRVSSQQLNFYGGAIGAKNGSILVELGDNSHPKFYGTGFYSGPGNPISVFGVAGTVGIDGLECYGCWNEGQQGLFGRIGPTFSPVIGAYRVLFSGQRSACVGTGTHVIDLTGLGCNLVWQGGYNDNLGQPSVYLESESTMTVYELQAGGFTYTGAGTPNVTEFRHNGVKTWLGKGLTDDISFDTNVGLTGRNSVGNRPSLIRLNSDDLCVLGDVGNGVLTKLGTGSSANFPAGAAKYNGVVGVDTTNNWLVYYVNGQRFKVTGTAY